MRREGCRGYKVLVYAGGFAPVGGVQTFFCDLTIELLGRSVDVEVVCWGKRGELLLKLEQAGVCVRRRAWRWGCRWGWPDRHLLSTGCRALARADVVLFGHLQPVVHPRLAMLRAAKGKPASVLVTPYRPNEMWGGRGAADDVLNAFDAIVVQADCFAEDLRRLGYRGDIRVLPYLPPPCMELAPLPAHPPVRIGFLGRLVPDKNLPFLLRAFGIVASQAPAELHLFGDGPEKALLEPLAAELHLGRSMQLHGSVPHAAVGEAIDSCHLFAFSSVREGQVLAALEILSRGRPLVGTPVGVFPELLSEPRFGALAPLENAEGFAEGLVRVARELTGGTLTPEMVQGAYRQKFSRDRVLDQYIRLFEELAGAKVACG